MSMSYLMQFFLLIPNISLVLLYSLEKCYREPFFCAISHNFLVFFHLHIIQHLICLSYPLSSLKKLSGKSYLSDFCYRCGAYNFNRAPKNQVENKFRIEKIRLKTDFGRKTSAETKMRLKNSDNTKSDILLQFRIKLSENKNRMRLGQSENPQRNLSFCLAVFGQASFH